MIVVLAHTHPSVTSGGAEISAYTLYRGLLAQGQRAAFVAMCPEADLPRAHAKTPDEHLVPFSHERYDSEFHLADPEVADRVVALLGELGATTVVFHHFLFFGINTVRRAARDPRWRSLLVLHEFLAICHHHGQMVTRPALRLCNASSPAACGKCFPERSPEHFMVRRAALLEHFASIDAFVSPSQFLKDRFVDWGLAAERIAVIENGVPHLPGTEDPVREPADDEPVVIGFFGQINPFKGVDLILDALELLARDKELSQRVRLRVHGPMVGLTPEFTARFEKLATGSPVLDYRGPYQNDRVFELMRGCDYVLMASKWWENSPVVIQEAYACGRPLIVPGIGGMAEKIHDGVTGLHFQIGDARDLLRAWALAARPGMAARLRQHLPAVSTGEDMARHYLALIERCPAVQSPPEVLTSERVPT